jgi:hypothetical protein
VIEVVNARSRLHHCPRVAAVRGSPPTRATLLAVRRERRCADHTYGLHFDGCSRLYDRPTCHRQPVGIDPRGMQSTYAWSIVSKRGVSRSMPGPEEVWNRRVGYPTVTSSGAMEDVALPGGEQDRKDVSVSLRYDWLPPPLPVGSRRPVKVDGRARRARDFGSRSPARGAFGVPPSPSQVAATRFLSGTRGGVECA